MQYHKYLNEPKETAMGDWRGVRVMPREEMLKRLLAQSVEPCFYSALIPASRMTAA